MNPNQFLGCKQKTFVFYRLLLPVCFSLIFSLAATAWGQADMPYSRLVRTIETRDLGISHPAGLAFSPQANVLLIMPAAKGANILSPFSDIHQVSLTEMPVDVVQVAARVTNAANMAFHPNAGELLVLQSFDDHLVDIKAGSNGFLAPAASASTDIRPLELQDARGMAVDPESGAFFILDSAMSRILRIEQDAINRLDADLFYEIDLKPIGSQHLTGLALDPATGHLHTFNPATQILAEITQTGQLVATRDLSRFNLIDPQGMVFAPSGDLTDDPAQISLYIADTGLSTDTASMESPTAGGGILEVSFTEPVPLSASISQGTLIQTIDTSLFIPPSPDPSGIVYIDHLESLLVSDSEVNEMPNLYDGANLFEITLSGTLTGIFNTLSFSNEPTGVAYNPDNQHIFFSDDDSDNVYEIVPGSNGILDENYNFIQYTTIRQR